jgi:hypothetical protein
VTRRLFIYGNWASYDELSDSVPLSEELAMRQLSELLRLREQGVRFDGYLMDAFWYAKDGGYRTWRPGAWPNGPDRWLDACREHDLLPGLWFTVNTRMGVSSPAWEDSFAPSGWGMCLFLGGFLEDFMDVLSYWYGRGIRIFKFDFAEFNAVPPDFPPNEDATAKNIEAFRNALATFRKSHLEAVLMAFNGFEEREYMNRSDNPPGRYVDPAWLGVFDSLYCGDPRPADLPSGSFWRSVDMYTDAMTRLFETSGIPLDRIDNCGFMAGDTGTCYWRKKAGWKAMLLLSLARGGRIHVAYGDLSLFSEDDSRWWAEAQTLFAESDPAVAFGGWPGNAESYGWQAGHVAVAVNPDVLHRELVLPEGEWQVLCTDAGAMAELAGSKISLAGGQVALLGKHGVRWMGGPFLDSTVHDTEFLQDHHVIGPAAELEVGTHPVRIVVEQKEATGRARRLWPSALVPSIPIQVRCDSVLLPPMIDRSVWSGVSWWVGDLPSSARPRRLSITSHGETLRVRVLRKV